MSEKYKVLAWGDAATAGTGFGTVSRHILGALHSTGRYDIDHLAINFHGDFIDKNQVPWQMQPARLMDPRDAHGIKMFKRAAYKADYDIIWILNDIYVTHKAAQFIEEIRDKYKGRGKKPPVFIYYYPIDCHCSPWASGMLEAVDLCVCYTEHGREETLKTLPHIAKKLREIPHGVDTKIFKPASTIDRALWKERYFGISPDTKLIINVNRNSTRKQVPYSVLAFKEFRKTHPKSILYLHMQTVDHGGNLAKVIKDAGFNDKTDVLLPQNFSPQNPTPIKALAEINCAADMYLTTHLGEGWGLTITEAMAAGTPVVAPNNTCMPQQLGQNSERGYMYECRDQTWIDDSGYRPKGLISDIVKQMNQVFKDGPRESNPKLVRALEFAKQHDWGKIGSKWIRLFDQAVTIREKARISLTEEM